MPKAITCAECGAPLPAYAKGLCSRCALDGVLDLLEADTPIGSSDEPSSSSRNQPSPAGPPTNAPGGCFGDYELLEEIARGGMGVVYRARQVSLNRMVALKMILSGQFASKQEVLRFRAEAEAAANLRHPNIVAIHETGEQEGRHYFSMDYVRGRNLAEIAVEGPLPAKRAAQYARIVAEAIHYAHEQGVLHRDLKPSNILIDENDHPRITDFGLAKRARGDFGLTVTGQLLGSPNFMPPEQTSGKSGKVGPASDVYGLGAIVYHLLTGRPPFQAETIEDVLRQLHEADPVAPRLLNPSIPRDLETICLKCLEKDPAKRYPNARELADELDRFLRDEPIRAHPINAPEKIWRWCRRKPVLASMIALVFVVSAIGLTGILSQWQRAERNASSERHERKRAETGESNAVRQIYVDQLNLAQAAWELNNVSRVRQLLEDTATAPQRGFEWFYWQRQTHLEEQSLRGHLEPVLGVAFSPDGRWIVTGGGDKTARVWDAANGKVLRVLRGHREAVHSVAVSSDGQRIVTGSWDRTAMVWEAVTGQPLLSLTGHEKGIFAVAMSQDGPQIATCSRDQTAKLWDAASGALIRTFTGHEGVVWSVALSPDGERIVTGSWDKTAKVWTADNDSPLLTFEGHTEPVLSVAFSPDGERIVSGSIDQTAVVWEAATGEVLGILEGHSAPVSAVAFSRDGKRIATAGDDQTVRVWSVGSRYRLLTVKKHGSPISSVAFSPDGQSIVSGGGSVGFSPDGVEQIGFGGGDRTAKIWNVSNEGELLTLAGHNNRVAAATFSQDGRRIVTGSFDGTAKVWDVASGRLMRTLAGHTGVVRTARISSDGKRIVTGSWDGMAKVWDTDTGEALLTLPHNTLLMSVAFSPDGQRIATVGQNPVGKVWDAATGELLLTFEGEPGWIWSVTFSPDGRQILTANEETAHIETSTAKLWDAATGRELRAFKGHKSFLGHAAFSPDGQRITTVSADGTAKVWDAATGANLATMNGHSDLVMTASFSPDSQQIVTSSRDQTVRLWDATSGKELLTLKGRHGWVFSAAFSSDGKRIVTGNWDGTATVWEAASAEQVANWRAEEEAAATLEQRQRAETAAEAKRTLAERANQPGVISKWLLLGPIPFEGRDGAQALRVEQIAHESQLRPRAGERIKLGRGELMWREVRPEHYILDFNQALGAAKEWSVAYAVCYIQSEQNLDGLLLKVGSDDQAKIYLNGRLAYESTVPRSYPVEEDVVARVSLNAGINVLVFKVVNEIVDWQGSIRFIDAQGNPVSGLRITLDPDAKDSP